MIEALKQYDKSFAEGMLARTSFYLSNDPLVKTFKPIENEESIRSNIIAEICSNLNIPAASNKNQAIIDYLDDELEKSTRLDAKTENEVLTKLSARGELPTDLYKIKWQNTAVINRFKELRDKDKSLISETVKAPDLSYNFGQNYGASIFAKFYKDRLDYHSFFLLVVGKREGLIFTIDQVWWLQNDLITGNTFPNALELLRYFVEIFGVEVKCQGETSKLFINVNAQNKNEFEIDLKSSYKSQKGAKEVISCHYLGKDDENEYSIFFAIDMEKYKEYLARYMKYKLKNRRLI